LEVPQPNPRIPVLLTRSISSSFYLFDIPMAHTIASSSTSASPNKSYHVFIHHHGLNVKKTFASHLYHRLCSEHNGLRVFLDQTELRVGDNFDYQIKDIIKTASVHVAIFSKGYADSERCLNELLYMLESGAPIIPVFYDVEPAQLRWPQGKVGVYAEAPCILENEKTTDCQTIEEKPQHSSTTIQKWKEALSSVADISGLDLQKTCNGDEGDLVQKIVQRVLEEIESILSVGISVSLFSFGFQCAAANCFKDWSWFLTQTDSFTFLFNVWMR
jgi:hypothetical protein